MDNRVVYGIVTLFVVLLVAMHIDVHNLIPWRKRVDS